MLPLYDVRNVILFAPAIYDAQALAVQFDQGFTEILRKPDSWRKSDALASLEKFSGNLLLFIGNNDDVIPSGVVDLIDKHSTNVTSKEIIRFDTCPHAMHSWLDSHSPERKQVAEKITALYRL